MSRIQKKRKEKTKKVFRYEETQLHSKVAKLIKTIQFLQEYSYVIFVQAFSDSYERLEEKSVKVSVSNVQDFLEKKKKLREKIWQQ